MPKFGTLALTFIGEWTADSGLRAIKETARHGYDILEIPLLAPESFDAKTVRSQLADHGLEGRCTLILPKDKHMPFNPRGATEFLKRAVDRVHEMGQSFLGGGLYMNPGSITKSPVTEEELETCAKCLKEVARYANDRHIELAIEPTNRYETYILTSADEAVSLAERIGEPNVGVHLDTYHMAMEEEGFYKPVIRAGKYLKYLHVSETGRGMLGEGNVHWSDFFRALAQIRYSGPYTIETFSSNVEALIAVTCLWRKSKYSSDELAARGLAFMKDKTAQFGLN